jgi:flagellar basal-body rod protein FlgC
MAHRCAPSITASDADNLTEFRNRKISRARYANRVSSILSIAASGIAAATRRLEVSASNVANAMSDGPLPSADPAVVASNPPAYTPLRVDQVETGDGGTAAVVSKVSPATVPTYDPGAPYADPNGMVAAPNVDLTDEAMQQVIARYTLSMNMQVVRTYQQMMKSLLDIKT